MAEFGSRRDKRAHGSGYASSFSEFDVWFNLIDWFDGMLDWSTSCRKRPGCLRPRSTRKRRAVSWRWVTSRTSTTPPRRTACRRRRSSRLPTSTRAAKDRYSTSSTASTNSASSCVFYFFILTSQKRSFHPTQRTQRTPRNWRNDRFYSSVFAVASVAVAFVAFLRTFLAFIAFVAYLRAYFLAFVVYVACVALDGWKPRFMRVIMRRSKWSHYWSSSSVRLSVHLPVRLTVSPSLTSS